MYVQAGTISGALEVLAAGECRILAGGTDFFPALVDRPRPAQILDISAIAELSGFSIGSSEIRIGAGMKWGAVATAGLPPCFQALKEAAVEVGSIQIQNAGTIGGNLCNASPAADGVPPLLILDAEVEIASSSGMRRQPLSCFIQGNRRTTLRRDELVTAIVIPRTIEQGRSKFLKLGARRYLVISIVMVAAFIRVDDRGAVADARISVGACSETAARLPALENELIGKEARRDLSSIAGPGHLANLAPISDLRGTCEYRADAALQLVRRAIEACVWETADA